MWGRRWLTSRASITAFSPIYSNILLHLETGKACVCLCWATHCSSLQQTAVASSVFCATTHWDLQNDYLLSFSFAQFSFLFFLIFFFILSSLYIMHLFILFSFFLFSLFSSLILNVYFISSFLFLSFILLPFSSGSHCQIVNWKVVFSMFSVKPQTCRLSLLAEPPFPFVLLICNVLRDEYNVIHALVSLGSGCLRESVGLKS